MYYPPSHIRGKLGKTGTPRNFQSVAAASLAVGLFDAGLPAAVRSDASCFRQTEASCRAWAWDTHAQAALQVAVPCFADPHFLAGSMLAGEATPPLRHS